MQANAQSLQQYLQAWDNYCEIWEINKDAFNRRHRRLNPQVSSFDADIARYSEVANNVQTQETVLNIQFVPLDCSPLKFAILGHCQEWQNKFTSLPYDIATAKLSELHTFLETSGARVSRPPQTLDELGEPLSLWETLNADQPNIEAKFQPLYDQFAIMVKYEMPIPDEVQGTLGELGAEWNAFQPTLHDADQMLMKGRDGRDAGGERDDLQEALQDVARPEGEELGDAGDVERQGGPVPPHDAAHPEPEGHGHAPRHWIAIQEEMVRPSDHQPH